MHATEELSRIAKLDRAWSDSLCVVLGSVVELCCTMGLHQNACNVRFVEDCEVGLGLE